MQKNPDNSKINVRAPARTCLFGDHQDYLSLPVIACAINRYIFLNAVENSQNYFNIDLPDLGTERKIPMLESPEPILFGDHFRAAIKVLKKVGCVANKGYDIEISGNIAINAGTSSSSAVVVAWIKFMLEAYGCNQEITPEYVAQLAYEVEVVEQGGAGGKMDQYSIGLGNIIYLETDENTYFELIDKPLPGLIVGESGLPKETNAVLKELRDSALESVKYLRGIDSDFELKKVEVSSLDFYKNQLPIHLQDYFYAAVINHSITQKAKIAFEKDTLDLRNIGTLMNDHHQILRDILKITLPKIDLMIEAAHKAGAYGAKIVGSGKGGSIVVIAPENNIEKVIQAIKEVGKDAYAVTVDAGAIILDE